MKTDRENFRSEAARLFIDAAPSGDKVRIASFAGDAVPIGHGWLDVTPSSRKQLRDAVARIPRNGTHTDHVEALFAAARLIEELDEVQRRAYAPTVLLFTDGELDPDPKRGGKVARRAELPLALSRLRSLGAQVFTVALGDGDPELLRICARETGGRALAVSTPASLLRAFLDLQSRFSNSYAFFEHVGAQEAVTIEVPRWATSVLLTVLAGKHATEPCRPAIAGSACQLAKGRDYALFRCENPSPGSWTLDLTGCGAADVIASATGDLRLAADSEPPRFVVGEETRLRARMLAGDDILSGLPAFGDAVVTASFGGADVTLFDDGSSGDAIAGDGIYSRTIVPQNAGPTDLSVRLVSKAASLQASSRYDVLSAPIAVDLETSSISCFTEGGCTVVAKLRNKLAYTALQGRTTGACISDPFTIPASGTMPFKLQFRPPASGSAPGDCRIAVEGFIRPVPVPAVIKRLTPLEFVVAWWYAFAPLALGMVFVGWVVIKPPPALRGIMSVDVTSKSDGRVSASPLRLAGRARLGSEQAGYPAAFVLESRKRGPFGGECWAVPTHSGSLLLARVGREPVAITSARVLRHGDQLIVDEGDRLLTFTYQGPTRL